MVVLRKEGIVKLEAEWTGYELEATFRTLYYQLEDVLAGWLILIGHCEVLVVWKI